MPSFQRQCGGRSALMRINIWIMLGTLLALLAITRYMQHQKDTQRICANDPTAANGETGVIIECDLNCGE
jgi:hypothetical protein